MKLNTLVAMSSSSNALRPLGMIEKLYPARQSLGVYHSVIVTATYKVTLKLEDTFLYTTLRAAVPGLLHRHPSLCCYIEDGDTATPRFARLDTVDVRDVLYCVGLEERGNLEEKLQELHNQPWPVGPKPLWKLAVMREPPTNSDTHVDSALHIALVYHHAIGDGLSGTAFHQSLLRELESMDQKNQESQQTPELIRTPTCTNLTEPIEKLISLPLSWMFLMRQAMKEYAPQWLIGAPSTIWAGLPNKTLDELPFRSRVRLVSIRAEDLHFLIEASREHDVSLTSLLTASIASALANELPAASGFLGLTPYTLRRVTGTSMAEMVNQSTAFETIYAADILDRIRKASDAAERLDSLWATAGYFHTQMQSEFVKCPKDNLVGLLPYVIDHVDYYKKKFGKAREVTWELSNLGVFKASPGPSSKTWKLNSMIFTQGAMPLGAAFTVNCVSVQGKSLTLAITWQDQVVDEDLIDAVAQGFMDLPRLLQRNYPSEAA
ncbi:MAG: hypothetical protein Q9199_004782 [Rusavskia elegans]